MDIFIVIVVLAIVGLALWKAFGKKDNSTSDAPYKIETPNENVWPFPKADVEQPLVNLGPEKALLGPEKALEPAKPKKVVKKRQFDKKPAAIKATKTTTKKTIASKKSTSKVVEK